MTAKLSETQIRRMESWGNEDVDALLRAWRQQREGLEEIECCPRCESCAKAAKTMLALANTDEKGGG